MYSLVLAVYLFGSSSSPDLSGEHVRPTMYTYSWSMNDSLDIDQLPSLLRLRMDRISSSCSRGLLASHIPYITTATMTTMDARMGFCISTKTRVMKFSLTIISNSPEKFICNPRFYAMNYIDSYRLFTWF